MVGVVKASLYKTLGKSLIGFEEPCFPSSPRSSIRLQRQQQPLSDYTGSVFFEAARQPCLWLRLCFGGERQISSWRFRESGIFSSSNMRAPE